MPTIPEALTIAMGHHQAGRLQPAEQIYRQILQAEPNHPDALHFLGVLAAQSGQPAVAVEYLGRALELMPDNAVAHNNLGNVLLGQGRGDEAVACYRRALELQPDYADAHNNLGNALKAQGDPAAAIDCYHEALKWKANYAEASYNLGIVLREQGKLGEAIACYRRALASKADYADAHNNLGVALREEGKLDEALACYRQALAFNPDYAEAHSNLGNALKDQGKLDEAIASYRQALTRKPDYAEGHNNLGNALKDQGKLEEAVECFHSALVLKPGWAEAHYNLGCALNGQRDFGEAAACYRRALALKPDFAEAHWNQSFMALLTGDFERGWAEYEWRWHTKQQAPRRRWFRQPLWDGQPPAGRTILLYAEQGLGDTIQFIRYAPLVKDRGGRIVLECQPELLPLVAGFPGVERVLAHGNPLPAFDVQAPLLSLPGILRTTLDSIPAQVPYLRADPDVTQDWRKRLEPLQGLKVGIVWQGNPEFKDDRERSIPLRHFEALAQVEGVRLVSLQKGPGAEQLLDAPFNVLDLGPQLETFRDTAAVLMNLDLLISSCTSVPHLAGALGVPVWLALPFVPDWRWLLEREDSPWYPRHRLFRQTRPGAWSEVFERIAAALRGLAETQSGAKSALGSGPKSSGPLHGPDLLIDRAHAGALHHRVVALANLGISQLAQNRLAEAIASFQQAAAIDPRIAEIHNNLGIALRKHGKLDEAVACYARALALMPDFADAHNNLGVALSEQAKLDEAAACYRRAIALRPDYAEAHNNLGNALRQQGEMSEAVKSYHRALQVKPDYADAHLNLGIALSDQGKLDDAMASYQKTLLLKPDHAEAHWNLALLTLLTGHFERGWAHYERRWQTKQLQSQRRHFSAPLWDGQPLAGRTILLYAEQGLGDTIQFVRYVPLVKERGGRIVLECQVPLLPLLADRPGVAQLVAQGDPLPAFDVQAPLLSLPGILGTTVDSIPVRVPYLRADPERAQVWRQKLAPLGGFRVGIVWQGNPQVTTDRQRSLPLRHYEALARVEGVRLVSLQRGAGAEQLLDAPFTVLDLGSHLDTLSDTAAVLMNLDLLISSCTSVPHLAGALGVPVWLALAHVPDWRWLLNCADSPWYPHHRLFRQTRPGDWSGVFERMATALSCLVENRTSGG